MPPLPLARPLVRSAMCPYPHSEGTARALTWGQALALREELEKAALSTVDGG